MEVNKNNYRSVLASDYNKGERYYRGYINFVSVKEIDNEKNYIFKIESETYNKKYLVSIKTNDGIIKNWSCNCPSFEQRGRCKHVAAAVINKREEIFKNAKQTEQELLEISKNILLQFSNNDIQKKEQAIIDVEITVDNDSLAILGLRIGTNKKYVLKNKISDFLYCYQSNKETVKFGQGFTYDPQKQYFNKVDTEIIEYLIDIFNYNAYRYSYVNYSEFYLDDKKIAKLIPLLENKRFSMILNGKTFIYDGIQNKNPYNTQMVLEDGKYKFEINKIDEILRMGDFKYVATQDVMYKLDSKTQKLIKIMHDNNTNKIIFEKEYLSPFMKNIMPLVKEKIKISEDLKDTITIIEPKFKLYLDNNKKSIMCKLMIEYGDKTINYFDTEQEIYRDMVIEEEAVIDIINEGFEKNTDKKIFELTDDDLYGKFIEEGIENLKNKYETYITDKLKNINIIKTPSFKSSFSIGTDNIMKYEFNSSAFDPSELEDIIENINIKKKYHKLKNGNIVNIENNEKILEIKNLMEDLDISYNEIKDGECIIPKFKAIYIDSLKKSKYGFIETNNLFDELINKFNKYKGEDIKLSKEGLKILRDYQVTGIKWMNNIYKCGFGGILADEMGLGKSIQTIYLIKERIKENKDALILIVSPTSLVYNWDREFQKYGKELNYCVFAGNKSERLEKLEKTNANIYITTYGLLRQDFDYYKEKAFDLFIIDEAQNIKNGQSGTTKTVKQINANCKFALTGTPLENSVLELWSIFDFIMPGYLSNLRKSSKKYKINDFNEETNELIKNLNHQISHFILRRKKTDVLKDLPAKIENNILIDLNSTQKKLYAAEVKRVNDEINNMINTGGYNKSKFLILPLLTRLRQICIDPGMYIEGYKDGSSKIDSLIETVNTTVQNGHKILLFSSFKAALDIVKRKFKENNITYCTIDGSVSSRKRMQLVDEFNNGNTNVFLIMLKAGGTGLNLTSADTVIHLDIWWNPQAENQATDRSHRIGQTKVVEVIKFIAKGTIDERILELQNKKKKLNDMLIEGEDRDKNLIASLTEKELRNLISYENAD